MNTTNKITMLIEEIEKDCKESFEAISDDCSTDIKVSVALAVHMASVDALIKVMKIILPHSKIDIDAESYRTSSAN